MNLSGETEHAFKFILLFILDTFATDLEIFAK